MTLPEVLSKQRKRLKLNQEQMAERVGVSQGAISGWESPTGARPSAPRLRMIAEAYDIPISRLERLWLEGAKTRKAA